MKNISVDAGASPILPNAQLLLQLAERCQREEPSRTLDADIALVNGWQVYAGDNWIGPGAAICVPAYTASLDAAVMLVPLHDGRRWFWRVGESSLYKGWAHLNRSHPDHCDRKDEASANATTPALALCAAALRARAAVAAVAAEGQGRSAAEHAYNTDRGLT